MMENILCRVQAHEAAPRFDRHRSIIARSREHIASDCVNQQRGMELGVTYANGRISRYRLPR
jgi:hypothetical protein